MPAMNRYLKETDFWVRQRVLPLIHREGVNRLIFCKPPIDPDLLPTDVIVVARQELQFQPSSLRRSWEISQLWKRERLCSFRFPHLAYVLEGVAEICLGTSVLRIPSDTLLLIPPHVPIDDNQPHLRFLSPPVSISVKVIWFLVAPSLVRTHICYSESSQHFYTPLQFLFAPSVYPVTLTLMGELERKDEGYREVASSYLTAIFWQILRAMKVPPLPRNCASEIVRLFPEVSENSLSGQICRLILQTFPNTPSVNRLADLVGVSPSHLRHLFKHQTGQSLQSYLRSLKLRVAKILLQQTDFPIALVARILGFQDPLYFSRWFRRGTGFPPSEIRYSASPSRS
ncbi:MAG: AraC family transcriptional regulator [Armatimonadetes bacterium]|nr:AraC family transcriptional regulator [Armatimonadota bacterium]MCX7968526.1 AraC family transcriptional regulator [Armatimonadota bacterium]MDW8143029.1 AraC family transcriptional regulator [Armatimonadota bacterium]